MIQTSSITQLKINQPAVSVSVKIRPSSRVILKRMVKLTFHCEVTFYNLKSYGTTFLSEFDFSPKLTALQIWYFLQGQALTSSFDREHRLHVNPTWKSMIRALGKGLISDNIHHMPATVTGSSQPRASFQVNGTNIDHWVKMLLRGKSHANYLSRKEDGRRQWNVQISILSTLDLKGWFTVRKWLKEKPVFGKANPFGELYLEVVEVEPEIDCDQKDNSIPNAPAKVELKLLGG